MEQAALLLGFRLLLETVTEVMGSSLGLYVP